MKHRHSNCAIIVVMLSERQILMLQQLPKIGRKTIFKIAKQTEGKISDQAFPDFILSWKSGTKFKIDEQLLPEAEKKADEILQQSEKLKIQLLGYWNKQFPSLLCNIADPPVLIFVKGNAALLNVKKTITITGTRKPSSFGERAGRRLAELFAQKDFVIVSGLAQGCDTAAHRGCLDAHGKTIVVLAHGLDIIYPQENILLVQEILQNDGALVSEYPPGEKPQTGFFVERSRLKSGLGAAAIIIETKINSGTMHTVRHTEENKRPLACLRHPAKYANEPNASGNVLLIAENRAMGIGTKEEIEDFIGRACKSIGIAE